MSEAAMRFCLPFAAALVLSTASRAAETAKPFDWVTLTKSIREQMPPGPMSAWTPAQHAQANKALFACAMLGTMSADSGKGGPKYSQMVAQYMSLTCEYHSAPPDWAERPKVAAIIKDDYGKLLRAAPQTPPPDPQLDR